MRRMYLIVNVGFCLCLQSISFSALAQTVAVPGNAGTICTAPGYCLVRRPDGVLVYQNNINPAPAPAPLVAQPNGAPVVANADQGPATQPPISTPTLKTFGGLSLGVGIAPTFNIQGQRVSSATAVNNIVRVSQTNDVGVSFVGESHYFFLPNTPLAGIPAGDWGTGPFVAIDVGTGSNNNVITGYSIGWMIGFRSISWAADPKVPGGLTPTYSPTSSWNFGVGLRVDPTAQVLGDGLVANAPLPPGETTVRLKTEARYGIMLLSSFSF